MLYFILLLLIFRRFVEAMFLAVVFSTDQLIAYKKHNNNHKNAHLVLLFLLSFWENLKKEIVTNVVGDFCLETLITLIDF